MRITYCSIIWLFFLFFLETVASQFTGYYSCASGSGLDNCSISCGISVFDLTDLSVYLPSYTQIQYTSYFSTFTVAFVIPVCGSEPASTYDWSEGDIWQYDNGGTYYLGLYNDEWTYGTYNGEPALNVLYNNGEFCTVTGQSRFTNLYLVCNEYYTATSPLITVTEPSVCQYSIVVQYEDICSSSIGAIPTTGPTQSPVYSSFTNSNDDDSTGLSWQTKYIVLIPVGIASFLVIAGVAVYCFFYNRSRVAVYSPHVQLVETFTANNDNSIVNVQTVYTGQQDFTLE